MVEVSKSLIQYKADLMRSKRLIPVPRWLPSRARRSWRYAELLGLRRVRLT